MSHLNNEQKNEIVPFTAITEDPFLSMYEKEAEMVLLKSQISFQKTLLMEQINNTLKDRNKELFMELSEKYNSLIHQYSHLI